MNASLIFKVNGKIIFVPQFRINAMVGGLEQRGLYI